MVREIMTNALTQLFLSDIIKYIPMKAKVKRKTIEGMMIQKLPVSEQKKLSLNECLNFEENNYIIERFYNVLEARLSHCDLSSFYKNIKTLIIEEKPKSLVDKLNEILSIKADGFYSTSRNKIRIYGKNNPENEDLNSTKTHELIHLATTKKEGKKTLCGFKINKNKVTFATGINEGYTELINCRYFSKVNSDSYYVLQTLVKGIEDLVGKKKMESYFFSNNLNGLINSLENYAEREEILMLIQKIDKIHDWYDKLGQKFMQEKLTREARTDIANMKINKLKKELDEGKTNESDFKKIVFANELLIHGYDTYYILDVNNKNVEYVEFKTLNDQKYDSVQISFQRYVDIMDEYYESKKDNLKFAYEPWQNKNGIGIKDIIERERKAQELLTKGSNEGRDLSEVTDEINQMLMENAPKLQPPKNGLRPW